MHVITQSLPSAPHQVASDLPHVCPFCEKNCGRSVRACIQAIGDRKSLKRKIRRLKEKIDELINAPGGREADKQHVEMIVLRKMQLSLFDCYKNVSTRTLC